MKHHKTLFFFKKKNTNFQEKFSNIGNQDLLTDETSMKYFYF